MAVIRVNHLEHSNQSNYLHELTFEELNLTLGGWLVLIPMAWIGYSVGKEAKTNWFAD